MAKQKEPFGQDRWIVTQAKYLAMLAPFVSDNEIRYYLQGIYFEPAGTGAFAIATDGFRMGVIHDFKATVNAPFICPISETILSAIETNSNFLAVFCGQHLHLIDGDCSHKIAPETVASLADYSEKRPPINGEYPNWRKVLPNSTMGSEQPMNINVDYIADFGKVALAAGFYPPESSAFNFYQTEGETGPLVVRHYQIPEFLGLQMPRKPKDIEAMPEWLETETPKAAE